MKSANLEKLPRAARDKAVRLVFFGDAGFVALSPVQKEWSPRGRSHRVEGRLNVWRSAFGALDLDFGVHARTQHVETSSISDSHIIAFPEQMALQGDQRPTVALDGASTCHTIQPNILECWLCSHCTQFFICRYAVPKLNLVKIVRTQANILSVLSVTLMTQANDNEVCNMLGAYGAEF